VSFSLKKRFVLSQDEEQKSLEKILKEHFANKNNSSLNKASFSELISQEVQGEMQEASLSFDSLMQMQKRLTEIYHDLMKKKSPENVETSERLQEMK
jgi:hypothetical protein